MNRTSRTVSKSAKALLVLEMGIIYKGWQHVICFTWAVLLKWHIFYWHALILTVHNNLVSWQFKGVHSVICTECRGRELVPRNKKCRLITYSKINRSLKEIQYVWMFPRECSFCLRLCHIVSGRNEWVCDRVQSPGPAVLICREKVNKQPSPLPATD